MIGRINSFFRKWRKKLSRSEWSLRLLGLPLSKDTATEPGVVIIQVDGLAYTQLLKGLSGNRLPFVDSLLSDHKFSLRPLYSGQPSTTPAVQGELFFGVKTAVPAFEFIDRELERRLPMYSYKAADLVAGELSGSGGSPLLAGGSSYANFYKGGAAEARYCVQSMNLKSLLRAARPLNFLVILLLHFPKFFRMFGEALLEFVLSVADFFPGVFRGENLAKELKFIPTRVLLCILLREMIRFRVKMDVARGLPVVHANLNGYDEQSHRRGPNSRFAHWSLKGIDGVIGDIYRTALRSDCRAYRLIVYSDHGQEEVKSYRQEMGKSLHQAVREVVLDNCSNNRVCPSFPEPKADRRWPLRIRGLFRPLRRNPQEPPLSPWLDQVETTSMGPIGHVYLPRPIPVHELRQLARDLVQEAGIPLVLFLDGQIVKAVTREGLHDLESAGPEVLGSRHPFPEETIRDLGRVCLHKNAGDLVVSGWTPKRTPLTFSIESGAHGGPGPEETRGFVLLPMMVNDERSYLRPLDVRRHVIDLLKKHRQELQPGLAGKKVQARLKVLTYNIHRCLHMDGKINPLKTAERLNSLDADVIALQEVDVHKRRTHGFHQARFLADYLDMEYTFFPVLTSGREQYGLALLSRYPVIEMKMDLLPFEGSRPGNERRGAMLARIESPLGEVCILNTHLSLGIRERRLQMQALLGPAWLGGVPEDDPVIFCGDLNAGVRSFIYRDLSGRLRDVQVLAGQEGYPRSTFFSFYPLLRLDHIFVSKHLKPINVTVPRDRETRCVSDHLPILAEFVLKNPK
ncbi:MAG: endonuclease/exonuclease/phosphatase family protein [Desulfohalobiaceae bacterium]|nr:endonuclease/exonuclease/phosphatase family protein [Desulfohalobiaceae bacterium]